jgi:hypothetical protein
MALAAPPGPGRGALASGTRARPLFTRHESTIWWTEVPLAFSLCQVGVGAVGGPRGRLPPTQSLARAGEGMGSPLESVACGVCPSMRPARHSAHGSEVPSGRKRRATVLGEPACNLWPLKRPPPWQIVT